MEDLKDGRQFFETLGLKYHAHEQVNIEKVTMGGVVTYRFTPSRVVSAEVVVYAHGGAFIYGSIGSHRAMVSHIAAATGRVVVFVEYLLAPEHPFPAALHHTTAVIRELSKTVPGTPLALMGDSAGGNLAMSTALHLRQLNLPALAYQVLISPWLNMNATAASYTENEKNDPILTKAALQHAAALYTSPENFANPLVAPVFGAYAGFNPTLTLVGAGEILRDDALDLHQALLKAGSASRLEVFDHVTHVWTLSDIASVDSRRALHLMREFMDTVMAKVMA
jgi:epsilon-lactone hydrolase